MLLRPRGMHGVRRGRARELDLTGPLPKASDQTLARDGGTATATAPPTAAELLAPRPRRRRPGRAWRSRRPRPGGWSGCGPGWPGRRAASARALLGLLSRDRLDDDTWDEIEEVLITADVGRDARPADHVRPADQGQGGGQPDPGRGARDAPRRAARPGGDRGEPGAAHPAARGPPGGRAHGRRQRHRQDDHLRQARPGAGRRRADGGARRGRHVPRGGGRPAADLGRAGRRADRPLRQGPGRPGQRRLRRGVRRASSRRRTWCSSTPRAACTPRTT